MTPLAKVTATIGAVWLAVVAIATIWLIAGADRYKVAHYGEPPPPKQPGQMTRRPVTYTDAADYHTAGYITILVVVTVAAIIAVAVAYVWAGKQQDRKVI